MSADTAAASFDVCGSWEANLRWCVEPRWFSTVNLYLVDDTVRPAADNCSGIPAALLWYRELPDHPQHKVRLSIVFSRWGSAE